MSVVRVMVTMLLVVFLASLSAPADARSMEGDRMRTGDMYPALSAFLEARAAEFELISAERRGQIEEISGYVREQTKAGHPVRLVFVCTHNSRRSHMSQLWAAAAAEAYGLRVATHSGGTETTAFNSRAVAAMERAGFKIEKTTDGSNPVYQARMSDRGPAMICFSKAHDAAPNPGEGFGAVMVCDEADEACPHVPGATGRFALPFVDPKVSDGTPAEASTYDERCAQIAREMLYLMSRVRP